MAKKIAILGTAPSTAAEAPFGDPEWAIWGVSARGAHVTRADRWFELHNMAIRSDAWVADWRAMLSGMDCPIYMLFPDPALGDRVREFPAGRLVARFGEFFFTSSIAWMLALAIDEGAEHIGIWGVDLEYGTEYRDQRAGVQHFLHMARVLGIQTTVPVVSGLAFRPIPYPVWQEDPIMRKSEFRKEIIAASRDRDQAALDGLRHAIIETRGEVRGLAFDGDRATEAERKRKALTAMEAQIPTLATRVAKSDGALEELAWLQDYLRP